MPLHEIDLVLLAGSVLTLALRAWVRYQTLFLSSYFFNELIASELTGRILVATVGASLGVLGYELGISRSSVFLGLMGGVIAVAGIQMLLWAIGVRSYLLGTKAIIAAGEGAASPERSRAAWPIMVDKGLHNAAFRFLAVFNSAVEEPDFGAYLDDIDEVLSNLACRLDETPCRAVEKVPELKRARWEFVDDLPGLRAATLKAAILANRDFLAYRLQELRKPSDELLGALAELRTALLLRFPNEEREASFRRRPANRQERASTEA